MICLQLPPASTIPVPVTESSLPSERAAGATPGTAGANAAPAEKAVGETKAPLADKSESPAKATAAKAKEPAPEEQPFERFVPDLLMPAIARECQSYGGPAPELSLVQGAMPVVGSPCWMVQGQLPAGRRFWLCFTQANIQSAKTVALAEAGAEPSLLESFLIDERKMSLALLVSRLVQRLNGQKWLGPN